MVSKYIYAHITVRGKRRGGGGGGGGRGEVIVQVFKEEGKNNDMNTRHSRTQLGIVT